MSLSKVKPEIGKVDLFCCCRKSRVPLSKVEPGRVKVNLLFCGFRKPRMSLTEVKSGRGKVNSVVLENLECLCQRLSLEEAKLTFCFVG